MAVFEASAQRPGPAPVRPPLPRRRGGLAVAAVLGAVLVLPAALAQPVSVHDVGPGTDREHLLAAQEWVAAHPAVFHLTDLAIVLGLFCLAWFVRAVGGWAGARSRALGRRSTRLTTVGSVVAMVGLVAAAVANAVISAVRVTLVQPALDPGQAVDAYLQVSEGWYLAPFFLPYLLLVPLGSLIMMAGLTVSRTVPWWAAVVGLGFLAVIPFSPPWTAVGVLIGGLVLTWALGRGEQPPQPTPRGTFPL